MNQDTVFPDNMSAFQYACQSLDCAVVQYRALPAVVMDASGLFNSPEGVKREPDGTQLAILKIASEDGGFLVLSKTAGPSGPELSVGDLVAWMPAEYSEQLAQSAEDPRFGWVGVIFGTLNAQREGGSWVGKARFD